MLSARARREQVAYARERGETDLIGAYFKTEGEPPLLQYATKWAVDSPEPTWDQVRHHC